MTTEKQQTIIMTPEQMAELAWSEGWGCSRELQVRCIADAIRSAQIAEREACAVKADRMREICLAAADEYEAKGDSLSSERMRSCAAAVSGVASSIRSKDAAQ